MFSQPGGAGQPTVGSGEAVSRLRGTHGFGAGNLQCRRSCCSTFTFDCFRAFATVKISIRDQCVILIERTIPWKHNGQQGFESRHPGDGKSLSQTTEYVNQPVSKDFSLQP